MAVAACSQVDTYHAHGGKDKSYVVLKPRCHNTNNNLSLLPSDEISRKGEVTTDPTLLQARGFSELGGFGPGPCRAQPDKPPRAPLSSSSRAPSSRGSSRGSSRAPSSSRGSRERRESRGGGPGRGGGPPSASSPGGGSSSVHSSHHGVAISPLRKAARATAAGPSDVGVRCGTAASERRQSRLDVLYGCPRFAQLRQRAVQYDGGEMPLRQVRRCGGAAVRRCPRPL
jgi:hypothetical protein